MKVLIYVVVPLRIALLLPRVSLYRKELEGKEEEGKEGKERKMYRYDFYCLDINE